MYLNNVSEKMIYVYGVGKYSHGTLNQSCFNVGLVVDGRPAQDQ